MLSYYYPKDTLIRIEEILLIDEKTISRYRETYKNKGIEELLKSNYPQMFS